MSSDSDIFETTEESGTDETQTSDDDGTNEASESSGFDPNVSDDDGTDESGSDEESGFDPNVSENDEASEIEASEIEASEVEDPSNLNDITTVIPSEILTANPFLTQPDNQTAITTTQVPPTTISGQTLTQLSESLQPEKVKRTILPTIDRDLANLEKAARLAEVKVVLEGLPITGNINIDLKPHVNETFHQFDVRSKITNALIAPPYNVSIKAALIAGKIWCQKALYGVVYPEDIENSLREIQLRGV
jgi:hypothetical protein